MVYARVRPPTDEERSAGFKMVVKPLTDTEMGFFDATHKYAP